MTHAAIDLRIFPSDMRRVVRSWYEWQAASVRSQGKDLGRTRIPGADPEYEFWLANTPRSEGARLYLDIGGLSWVVAGSGDGWLLTKDERNLPSPVGELRSFADMEKYLLCLMGGVPYVGRLRAEAPGTRWYREGVHPRVRLEKVDPTLEYSDRLLYVDDEVVDRGHLGEIDAVRFSHPLVMNYQQIESTFKAGLPSEWFAHEIDLLE
ncbi:hypothetical protein [Nocardia sp. CS682]|uniref:hypothetical protein n=1 Tax=Nocardia sp. CS682 TaxID=1047172 RepID=UPI00107550BE|nr:hypothetical protein [Nocardia sp. CS682]